MLEHEKSKENGLSCMALQIPVLPEPQNGFLLENMVLVYVITYNEILLNWRGHYSTDWRLHKERRGHTEGAQGNAT